MKITGKATEMIEQDTDIVIVRTSEYKFPLTSIGDFQAYLDIVIGVKNCE